MSRGSQHEGPDRPRALAGAIFEGSAAGAGAAMMGAESPIRVMVVDDHDLFRVGLRRLFTDEPGLEVVADVSRGEEAVRRARHLRPQVVVMDTHMPEMSGIEATRLLLDVSPASAVLMLTGCDAGTAIFDAVCAGAIGYLLKDAPFEDIVRGVRAAAAGESLIAPGVCARLLAQVRARRPTGSAAVMNRLSPRELAVLNLMVDGYDNAGIAREMNLSVGTVKHHVSNTLDRLGVSNRIQASVMAVRCGLVEDSVSASA